MIPSSIERRKRRKSLMIPLGIEIPLFVVQLQCLCFSPLSANSFRQEYPVPCLRLTLNSSPTSKGFHHYRASEICSHPAISASTMQQLLSNAISGFKDGLGCSHATRGWLDARLCFQSHPRRTAVVLKQAVCMAPTVSGKPGRYD